MTCPTDAAFAGFPREGLEFLAGLAEDNSRAYFDAHRDVYEGALLAPAKAFVVALGEELRARVAPGLRAGARAAAGAPAGRGRGRPPHPPPPPPPPTPTKKKQNPTKKPPPRFLLLG